jgi:hypothetical protein
MTDMWLRIPRVGNHIHFCCAKPGWAHRQTDRQRQREARLMLQYTPPENKGIFFIIWKSSEWLIFSLTAADLLEVASNIRVLIGTDGQAPRRKISLHRKGNHSHLLPNVRRYRLIFFWNGLTFRLLALKNIRNSSEQKTKEGPSRNDIAKGDNKCCFRSVTGERTSGQGKELCASFVSCQRGRFTCIYLPMFTQSDCE